MRYLTNSTTLARPVRRSRSAPELRRGYVTVGAIMIIMIGIVPSMLVVNWTYLVLVNQHTLRLTDSLALTAVYQLLDEQVLSDSQSFPATQANDITAANNEILTPGTGFLARNNAAAGATLRPTAAQVTITPGSVDNANAVVTVPGNYTTAPAPGQPNNTQLVNAFNAVAASNNPRRAFPIYTSGINDPLEVVGFIAARVVSAYFANPNGNGVSNGNPQVRVRQQPDFIVHPTVETRRNLPGATSVPENLYIHKIRLTR